MGGEIIKSFLVGLGFGVDDNSLSKFYKAISSATVRVTALYASIKVASAGIFYSIAKISEGFEEMGYSLRLVAPAANKMLLLREAMLSAYRAAGVDLTKVVKQSILFNFSLAKTKIALEAVYKSVGARFLPMLTKQMDIFRGKIFANMPKIQAALEKFVKFIFKAFEATVILGTRLWSILGRVNDFFKQLDQATDGWSTKILGFIAIWKLLNLSFLATPIGMILTGLVALLALYDDFKTWQEGGESLFDWSKFLPVIADVKNAIQGVIGIFKDLGDAIAGIVFSIHELFSGNFSSAFEAIKHVASDVLGVFSDLWKTISGVGSALGTIGSLAGKASGFFGGGSSPVLNNALAPAPLVPAGGNGVHQRVSQETNININGSADASSVGKAVASEQGKVNFDLTRNLKGAAQ